MTKFQILWPERGAQIRGWYEDAVANEECDDGAETFEDMARALDDAGLITLGKTL